MARWRWVLVAMVIVVAGCLPRPSGSALEAAFMRYLDEKGMTFAAADPGAGVMSAAEVVAAVQATTGAERLSGLEAVPIFGVLRCRQDDSCGPGPGALPGMTERSVWVLFFPELEDFSGTRTGGWIIIDGLTGLESGFEIQTTNDIP